MLDELTRIPESRLTPGQADYLEVLGDLTHKFEEPQMAGETDALGGVDLLRHLLEANDMNASDLGRLLGQRELGSKILRGDRQISRTNAKVLGRHFRVGRRRRFCGDGRNADRELAGSISFL